VCQDGGNGDVRAVSTWLEADAEPVLGENRFDQVVDVFPEGIGCIVVALAMLGDFWQIGLHLGERGGIGSAGVAIKDTLLHLEKAFHLVDINRRVHGGALDNLDDRCAFRHCRNRSGCFLLGDFNCGLHDIAPVRFDPGLSFSSPSKRQIRSSPQTQETGRQSHGS
jgi:hypothetical protein